MDHKLQEQIALHRWAVIAEAAGPNLTPAERGALARRIAARSHPHPDGSQRTYSRGTVDRWLRAWRAGGLDALKPPPRSDTGIVRAHPELFAEACALRLELPGRSAAQIASILWHRHGVRVPERTVRGQLRRAGLHREALAAEPKAYGRYEAAAPNERWITDVLVGPWVPFPKRDGSARARLFLIVDDHSRLLVDGRFYGQENARACQELLRRAITRKVTRTATVPLEGNSYAVDPALTGRRVELRYDPLSQGRDKSSYGDLGVIPIGRIFVLLRQQSVREWSR